MSRFRIYGLSLLIALLFVVYTLTNSGKFHIVDEVSLFALTESLGTRAAVDTNAIAWTQWVNSPGEVLGAFGPEGDVYSKKGPAPAFVALPAYLSLRLVGLMGFHFGLLQATLLWNGLLTALTAALLWLTALRLGYNDRSGAILGLLFGLATIAWPYANHFFGEPLSALALLALFYAGLRWRQGGGPGWMALAGAAAATAVATVTAHLLVVAFFALYALAGRWWDGRKEDAPLGRSLVAGGLAFALPLLVSGLLLLWYNFARFGSPFSTGYHFESGEGFTTPIWRGIWGLLFSPYRSVFLHTPLFFASLAAFPAFLRRHRDEALLIGAVSLLVVALYGAWWMWWGGFAWGPRFLVPLTPFWVLLLAPLVERIAAPSGWRRGDVRAWLLVALALLSFIVQLSAVSLNYVNYEIDLRDRFPTDWADPLKYGPPAQAPGDLLASPVFGQWRLLAEGAVVNSDLAWLWPSGNVQWLVVLVGGAALLTLALLGARWWIDGARPLPDDAVPSLPVRLLVLLAPLVLLAVWTGSTGRDPHYGEAGRGYRAILNEVCARANSDDVLVTITPFSYQIPMNWLPTECRRGLRIHGYAANSMVQPQAQAVLGRLLGESGRIWLVTGGLPANDPDNTVERWLADTAFKADDVWYDDYRLVPYATPKRLAEVSYTSLNVPLFDSSGFQATVLGARMPDTVAAGRILPVEISFRLDTPPAADLRWFVQLLAPDGVPAALLDSAPSDGYVAFSTLPNRQDLIEHAGLQLPAGAAPGVYQLIAGFYNPEAENAPRLRTPDGSDFVELGKIQVE